MAPIGWGIAGTGRIARTVLPDFIHVPDAHVAAVASRTREHAESFADLAFSTLPDHPRPRAYASYAEMLEDPDVDVVYVATPHPQHKPIALAALAAGKAILVEKSFAATHAGASEIVEAARAKGLFAMEGIWSRFLPVIREMDLAVAAGEIGEVTSVQGDLFALRDFDPEDRLFNPELGGGATLDLGVYAINFAVGRLGSPTRVTAAGSLFPNGVDADVAMLLEHRGERTATLAVSLRADGPGRMAIHGTHGWIEVEPRFHHPSRIVVHRRGVIPQVHEAPQSGRGYSHELIEVGQCLRDGRTESTIMPLDDTLEVSRVMQSVLEQVGVTHHDDEELPHG
ncbi:Gfo/Idh/MocA family protein [Acidipropionibacterium virtanenii]|uniref:Glucose--fructose oxidoreductase n=1 Tax=Acidipropionibacterium virtanenii TaxID=2057246 RepID=A0A344UX21_9ACTN|nr:Gfo/Idh/MocA family oxidoreductase [Acidipropionibacterium virtanenii]AXE39819.1 Glucose--fructose oxidoreductase [Acidipropionibacterium virtanenii]